MTNIEIDHEHQNWAWRLRPQMKVADQTDCVIIDIDGVIADASWRQDFITRGDWEGFFANAHGDPLIEEHLHHLDSKQIRVLLTGRPVRIREITIAWFEQHKLEWDLLIMRDFGDYRASNISKRVAVENLRRRGLNPILAVDDDNRNIAIFEEMGIATEHVDSGYYKDRKEV